jgi:hypothetical protein
MDPHEIVFHVVAEAHEFGTLEAYARSLVDLPVEAAPLSRIGAQTEASVRARMKGKPRDQVDAAVWNAIGDAVFRYILFLHLNTSALAMAELEGLRAAATFYWMGCLLGGPGESDLEPGEWTAHQADLAESWQLWRAMVAGLLVVSLVEEEAREQLEARYLGGQPALLSGVQEDWDRFADQTDRLWSIANRMEPMSLKGVREPSADEGEQAWDDRVADRARKLADDARISTFDRLGENARAVAILERRLGT